MSQPPEQPHATFYVDGKKVEHLTAPQLPKPKRIRPAPILDHTKLIGPKLKIQRAECHIAELERIAKAWGEKNPYRLSTDIDAKTSEQIFRVGLTEPLPIKLSAILGDIVHNIRAALDHLICDLIRANKREPHGGSGFPIAQRRNKLKPGKFEGVSAKVGRLILRLKPYEAGNPALWQIHMLDVLDKHAGIIPVAAATGQVIITIPAPLGLSFGPNGKMAMGSTPPGFTPLAFSGHAETFKPVLLLDPDTEIYRAPFGLNAQPQGSVTIAFGKGQICEGEPVVETLKQYVDITKRIISVFERRCM